MFFGTGKRFSLRYEETVCPSVGEKFDLLYKGKNPPFDAGRKFVFPLFDAETKCFGMIRAIFLLRSLGASF